MKLYKWTMCSATSYNLIITYHDIRNFKKIFRNFKENYILFVHGRNVNVSLVREKMRNEIV